MITLLQYSNQRFIITDDTIGDLSCNLMEANNWLGAIIVACQKRNLLTFKYIKFYIDYVCKIHPKTYKGKNGSDQLTRYINMWFDDLDTLFPQICSEQYRICTLHYIKRTKFVGFIK